MSSKEKQKGFTSSDLEAKGFVMNEQGFYAKPSYPIKPESETNYTETIKEPVMHNNNIVVELEPLPVFTYPWTTPLISFNIDPLSKPRMTIGDKYKKRPAVLKYWIFKDKIKTIATTEKFVIPHSNFHMIFTIEMPQSWAKSKKDLMLNRPHTQRPDVDNLNKAVFDCLCEDDSYIWDVRCTKIWGWKGKIEIFER